MKSNNINNFGIAVASSFALLYLLCVVLRLLGLDAFIYISNIIFHGLDFSSITMNTVTWSDTIFGFTLFSALGYVMGLYIAGVYKFLSEKKSRMSNTDQNIS